MNKLYTFSYIASLVISIFALVFFIIWLIESPYVSTGGIFLFLIMLLSVHNSLTLLFRPEARNLGSRLTLGLQLLLIGGIVTDFGSMGWFPSWLVLPIFYPLPFSFLTIRTLKYSIFKERNLVSETK